MALPLAGRAQFTFTISSGSITITGYTSTNVNMVIPSATNGYPVKRIGNSAFAQKTYVKSVTIPDSITNIGVFAFQNCSGMTNVVMGNSVAGIGNQAFQNCSALENVLLPASLVSIGTSSFYGCASLTSVAIPGSVTTIGAQAFGSCVFLSSAYFQGNAPTVSGRSGSLDNTVFSGNSLYFLQSGVVYYPPGTTGWGATFGSWPTVCTSNTTAVSAFNFATNNGGISITKYVGTNQDVIMPGSINGYPITAIGDNAFGNQYSLRSVLLPNSVTSIGNQAFYNCGSLVNVPLPNNLNSIGNQAFQYCDGVTYMTIPSGVTNIGSGAFQGCYSLLEISVAAGNPNYASLGGVLFDSAFTKLIQYPNALAGSYVVPNSVTTIGSNAFFIQTPSLTDVTIPNSVLSIEDSAFSQCPYLHSFTVASDNPNYTSVGGVLFDKAVATLIRYPGGQSGNYSIPSSVTIIGESAFFYSYAMTSVTIPNNLTSIGTQAFYNCPLLTSVTIPNQVTGIGQYAFKNCTSLHQAYFQGNAPLANGGVGSADNTVFQGESGTVFYQPGTTGWESTFGGWPTVSGTYQPQPQILGSGQAFGVQSNQFNFTISWATNSSVAVETSTNLVNWTPVITNALVNGSSAFVDSTWTNYPQQFYRVRAQ
jgi:hypothetical protein